MLVLGMLSRLTQLARLMHASAIETRGDLCSAMETY